MNHFTRILYYAWPYRRRLVVSFFFAILVALLWGANLSVTFLVVKVLLQGESLSGYVQSEVVATEELIQEKQDALKDLAKAIQSHNPDSQSSISPPDKIAQTDLTAAPANLLSDQSRQQRKLSNASHKLSALKWIQSILELIVYVRHC